MSRSVSGVSAQAGTLATVTSRRHLPTWMTSGTFAPVGTSAAALPRTNAPDASVFAATTGSPESVVVQASQLGPSGMGASARLGT